LRSSRRKGAVKEAPVERKRSRRQECVLPTKQKSETETVSDKKPSAGEEVSTV